MGVAAEDLCRGPELQSQNAGHGKHRNVVKGLF